MSELDDTTVMNWNEANDHADDNRDDADDAGFAHTYDPATARTVLSVDSYFGLIDSAANAIPGEAMSAEDVMPIVDRALAWVGFLCPPPAPDHGTCGSQWPNAEGEWVQCTQEPGHASDVAHNDGDFFWSDDAANVVPPPAYATEPPF
ncbi:hypothetical protein [Streptomyces sp. NPDC054838]